MAIVKALWFVLTTLLAVAVLVTISPLVACLRSADVQPSGDLGSNDPGYEV